MSTQSSIAETQLLASYFHGYPREAAKVLATFPAEDILNYLHNLPLSDASQIYTHLDPEDAGNLIPQIEEGFFVQLFSTIDPALAAKLLARLDAEVSEKRLSLLPAHLAKELHELMHYPPETAGYLMDYKVIPFHLGDTVEFVLEKIRAVRDRRVVNINVLDDSGHLVGAIPLQEVAVSQPAEHLRDLIQHPPVTIQAMAPREEVVQLLDEHKLLSLPVVDIEGKLLGMIRYEALMNAAKQDATGNVQAMFGAGREERALSKATFAISKRLPWLEINLITAFLASAVVGLFEETIAQITVLAVFLPVVAGQSGNTGSQALAVTMRGLALREIRARHWLKVARKEVMVGFVNGCAVALTTAVVVYFWASSLALAAVIAVAMVISMVVAGFSGAVIPIILKTIGQDPAQSSSIILTTVTDVVGFMSFLGLATLLSGMIMGG